MSGKRQHKSAKRDEQTKAHQDAQNSNRTKGRKIQARGQNNRNLNMQAYLNKQYAENTDLDTD